MTFVTSIRTALAAGVCLLPLQALAQSDDGFDVGDKPASAAAATPPTNWVTLGGQYDSSRGTYLNRFTGAANPGFYGLGDFHVGRRDAWDSGGTWYFSADGADLGLDSRSFNAKVGQQGTWGLSFSYDGVPYLASDGFESVWTGNGALVPGVPYGSLSTRTWPSKAQYPAQAKGYSPLATGTAAGSLPIPSIWFPITSGNLAGSLYDYNIGTRRDIFTGTGKYQWNDWTIAGSVRHEHKTGYQANSLEIGGTVGLTGTGTGATKNGAPAAGIASGLGYFAMPIDYETDRYDITATYNLPRLQFQVGYMFSKFTDNITEFNAIDPFALGTLPAGGNFSGAGVTPGGISAPYSLPPSNSAHQVKVLLGYNLSPTTRVNANFAYGVQMQNDAYVTGSGVPNVNPYLSQNSFKGLVQTLYGNVALVTQPLPKLDIRLAYTIDNRDNQSSRNYYGDNTRSTKAIGEDCGYAVGGGSCMNLPYGYEHQTISAEAGYRILPHTKISLNDTFETTYRTFADTSFVTSNRITARLRSELGDDIFGSISYSHEDRNANNTANGNTWALLTNGGVGADPASFLMYSEASRKRDEVKATLDMSPMAGVGTTVMFKYASDTYPGTIYGLRNNNNFEIGPDASWDISRALNAHAYYTYQQIFYEQASLYSSPGNGLGATNTGYYVPWTNKSTDSVHTFGVAVNWQAVPEVLTLSLGYNFSYGATAYAIGDGMAVIGLGQTSQTTIGNLTLQQLPDVTSMLSLVSLRGEYTFRPNWTVVFGYQYERFTYKDFMNNVGPTQYANAIFPGTFNPNESIHVIGAGLRVRF